MKFNSWEFIIFFIIVYTSYLLIRNYRWQNVFLLFCGYYFYAAWDWRFLSLLIISTVVDYFVGIKLDQYENQRIRKVLITLSVGTQLTILGFFKYFNFFADNLHMLLSSMGIGWLGTRLDIVLPVGISFYTFQTMSYTIDIYRRQFKPTRNFIDYSLFASFFPQLMAGPIERAKSLLPQIQRIRQLTPEGLESGCWLIFWGLYKKIVIADNMAPLVERVFEGSATATVLMSYLGVLAFAVQIYCDFSGYSDIARGTARLLGFDLMRNFNLPFFARNPQDFWRRWHISLSTWLRDYLYISLGGNRRGKIRTYINLFITMLLGGLWHGASWNFIWWGAYHGFLLSIHRIFSASKRLQNVAADRLTSFASIFFMFQVTLFGWLLFRSNRKIVSGNSMTDESFDQIMEFITSYRNGFGFDWASFDIGIKIALFSAPLIIIQIIQYIKENHYFMLQWQSLYARASLYAFLIFIWLYWGVQSGDSFIYFQF
jgi:alginate O-acetyltransferase complex protein AlgI